MTSAFSTARRVRTGLRQRLGTGEANEIDDAVRLAPVAGQHGRWPALADMQDNAVTLDGVVESSEAVFEAKFMLPWAFSSKPFGRSTRERIELLGRVRRRLHPLTATMG